jgi:hypothetical protein
MKRPLLVVALGAGLLAAAASAQTLRDYATIYGARGDRAGAPAPEPDVATTVGTGPQMRYAKPQPGSEPRSARGTGRDYGYSDYGRISGGYAEYGSAEFPSQQPAQPEPQAVNEESGEAEGEEEGTFLISEGFFFDNYTSGRRR